jgi:hypothetical protein
MTNTWLKVGSAGVGVGVGAGVGDGVDAGVAVGLGVAVGVAFVLAVGLGLPTRVGAGVACAELVGLAVGVPARPGVGGIEDWDGATATGGRDANPGALGDPSSNDVIHKSNPPTAAQTMSRRNNHMSGTPPTHH